MKHKILPEIKRSQYPLTYEEMILTGKQFICQETCQVGDIINDCFIMPYGSNKGHFKKGNYCLGIPLEYIGVVETHADLSEYGFIEVSENRWIKERSWN